MTKDDRRITLIAAEKQSMRTWERPERSASRMVHIDSLQLLRSTIDSPLVRSDADVERIIFDQCCSEAEYLMILSTLPHQFTGDVLLIRGDATSFLSASGRGGDRILYALSPEDVEFYLETVQLVPRTEVMERHVLQFRPRIVQRQEHNRLAGSIEKPDSAIERR